jgi:hypothetical protein
VKTARVIFTFATTVALAATSQAAKQDETEGTAGISGQSRETYQKTDKKASQRPGQTITLPAVAPAKGPKGESKATKGEETSGTAPASGAKAD